MKPLYALSAAILLLMLVNVGHSQGLSAEEKAVEIAKFKRMQEKVNDLRRADAAQIGAANGGYVVVREISDGESGFVDLVVIRTANGFLCEIGSQFRYVGKELTRTLAGNYCSDGRSNFRTNRRGQIVSVSKDRGT